MLSYSETKWAVPSYLMPITVDQDHEEYSHEINIWDHMLNNSNFQTNYISLLTLLFKTPSQLGVHSGKCNDGLAAVHLQTYSSSNRSGSVILGGTDGFLRKGCAHTWRTIS